MYEDAVLRNPLPRWQAFEGVLGVAKIHPQQGPHQQSLRTLQSRSKCPKAQGYATTQRPQSVPLGVDMLAKGRCMRSLLVNPPLHSNCFMESEQVAKSVHVVDVF